MKVEMSRFRELAGQARLIHRASLAMALVLCGVAATAGAAQAASPAWKLLAVTGPTNLPPRQSEVQKVTVEAEGGTFTLSPQTASGEGTLVAGLGIFEIVEGSSQMTYLAGQEAAPGMGVSSKASGTIPLGTTVVAVEGSTVTISAPAERTGTAFLTLASKEVTGVSTSDGSFNVGDGISGEHIPTGTTVASISGETVTLSQAPEAGGTVTLTGTETTAPLASDASADALQGALRALPAVEPTAFTVSGGPGGSAEHPYVIEFGGRYADEDVAELSADGSNLLGQHAYVQVSTLVPGGPGTGEILVSPANVGGADSSGEMVVEVGPLPAGIVTAGQGQGSGWTCSGEAGEETATCTSVESTGALRTSHPVAIPVEVESEVESSSSVQATISGAGGGSASTAVPIVVSARRAAPGVQAFWAGAFDSEGRPFTQAGGHPFSAMAFFQVDTVRSSAGEIVPAGDLGEVLVDLPPGFLGDPLVTKRCPQDALTETLEPSPACDSSVSGVGALEPYLTQFGAGTFGEPATLFNDVPPKGAAAEFTTKIAFPLQSLVGSVRSDEDLGVRITAANIPNYYKLFGTFAVLKGFPAGAAGKPFLDNPTDCAQQREESAQGRGPATRISTSVWQEFTLLHRAEDSLPLITGCGVLTDAWLGDGPEPEKEEPSFSFQPTTDQASSPAGAAVDLHIPQEGLTDPGRLATAHLKKAIVTLPQGLTVNPSSANGLEACSEAQVGYLGSDFPSPNRVRFNESPVTCPDGSKLGNFTITTPLLEEAVEGTIYLAAQEENPFNSLIALYLVVENERFGLTLKLPGEVRSDPTSGQLTATFDDNPQLPFEDLTLHFRGGGGRSTLATPETCGHFETTGSLEPWSAENGEALPIHEDGFSVSGSCASSEDTRPFAPLFEAGTTGVQAGAYSPLVIKVARKDGEQELKTLDFTLPKGLVGKLAGIPYCSETAIADAAGKSGSAERSSPSCPAASQIGTVDTAAGVGSEPIHVGGKVYLAGPYRGAPLSSVVVTPAVAGPFDLGDVVVRAPLYVNPETTEITAKSDQIPTILKGIPLKVRQVAIYLDRSDFTLNPTNCEAMSATASIGGSSGATASPSNRFQVGGCDKLKFKPKLKISLKGSTKHAGFPALKAVVTFPKKGSFANIARAQVNLPHSEFLEQNNLNKTCTKPVLLEGKCPKSTIYGKAKAWTPLLDQPLRGPVYLVGGYGYKLPALVAELNGQIRVVLKGKVDSGPNKGIRNTFEAIPDAPVSRFVLEMKGGKKYGLLVNSENLCRKPQRGLARFTAQNGLVQQTRPLIANQCGKKKGGKHKRKQRPKRRASRR